MDLIIELNRAMLIYQLRISPYRSCRESKHKQALSLFSFPQIGRSIFVIVGNRSNFILKLSRFHPITPSSIPCFTINYTSPSLEFILFKYLHTLHVPPLPQMLLSHSKQLSSLFHLSSSITSSSYLIIFVALLRISSNSLIYLW